MSLFIATPCYGGMLTEPYVRSSLQLREYLHFNGVRHTWHFVQDSLVGRARNLCAEEFMRSDYERLFFIDADIEFDFEDVGKLWALDADIGVGLYTMKKPGAARAAWVNGSLVPSGLEGPPFEVDYAGTGFMMIKRGVLEGLRAKHPGWKYEEGKVGECWAFFQDPIEDGIHLSEDYFFCKRAREAGFRVVADPSISLGHWGTARYGD